MTTMTPYEHVQLARISAWREDAPTLLTRAFGKAAGPAGDAVERIVPAKLLRAALESAREAGLRVADRKSILKRAGVDTLDALHNTELETCDRLSARVRTRGMALAGGSGAVFGVAGGFGMIADVPSLLVQTFRAIHRVGLCYGEDCLGDEARRLPVAVFALASASSSEEKRAALLAIDHVGENLSTAWRESLERAAERELAKEAAIFSLNNLAKTVTRRLGVRKAAGSVPVIGALVGGTVNALYLSDVAQAAQATFQMRWLWRKYATSAEDGEPAPHPLDAFRLKRRLAHEPPGEKV